MSCLRNTFYLPKLLFLKKSHMYLELSPLQKGLSSYGRES